MREKELKKRAGVSPAIATILLILIAIAAGIIIYAYTVGYLGTSPGGKGAGEIAIQTGELADAAGVGLYDNVTVFVKNVGGTDLEILDVYVELTGGGPILHLSNETGATLPFRCVGLATCKVEPGETARIENIGDIGDTGSIVSARDSTVRVVCADGTADARSIRAHE